MEYRTNNDGSNILSQTVYTTPTLYSCTMIGGTVLSLQQTNINGTTTINYTEGSKSWAAGLGPVWVGTSDSNNELFNSYICEIVYYSYLLPTTLKQQVEGYLAWKWGLQSKLPVSNPYISVSPNYIPPGGGGGGGGGGGNIPICFLKGTQVETDQEIVDIDKIDISIHTINGKKIVAVTKTPGGNMSLVKIKANLIDRRVPYVDTVISVTHKILYNNVLMHALFIPGATSHPSTNDFLYNVLLETHETMKVNGMVVETLSPNHPIAKSYLQKYKD
jgi:hypothetical protein